MASTESGCVLCGAARLADVLDFGRQPLCNRFLASPTEPEYVHTLVLGQCPYCALIQITDPVPTAEMSSRFEWIVYREPEDHLDHLADVIAALPGVTPGSTVCGLSTVDDSLLRRLAERGLAKWWRLDLLEDLGSDVLAPGVEVIQEKLDPGLAARLATRRGRPDVVVGRYALEHAHHVRRFLASLKALVHPRGYVVVEVPDCLTALENHDYSAVWEEHILYFTPTTLKNTFRLGGFSEAHFESYPYRLQNSLVLIGVPFDGPPPGGPAREALERERSRWRAWVGALTRTRVAMKEFLAAQRRKGGRIAVFGAAQRACSFINLLELKQLVDLVVDDDVCKHGFFMPGSRLPIRPPSALFDNDRGLCLLAARPESQDKMIRAHQRLVERGGSFASIYPDGSAGFPL